MASWLGYATTKFYGSAESPILPSNNVNIKLGSLLSFVKEITPPCYLNPFLFNGHLQTFWTAVKPADIPIYYKRHVFQQEDPAYTGSFAVDFVTKPYHGTDSDLPQRTTYYAEKEFENLTSDDKIPMVVTLHGLAGGSDEVYLRATLKPLVDAGWEACVVNSRGCANSKITSSVLYNARATWDLRQTVKWLRKQFPNRPLFGLGFSLGANMMTTYLGEEGENCELKAAVVCSSPFNLEAGSLALQRTWLGLEVYSKTMCNSMKKLVETHMDQISKNPYIDDAHIRSLRASNYLHEFDRFIQGPTWGYPTEGAYYRDASSCDSILAIRVPLLAIHAQDDPIAVGEALPFEEFKRNPMTVLVTTSLGGHLSWFEIGGGRWFAKPVFNFLLKMAKEVDFDKLKEEQRSGGTVPDLLKKDLVNFAPMRRKLQGSRAAYQQKSVL